MGGPYRMVRLYARGSLRLVASFGGVRDPWKPVRAGRGEMTWGGAAFVGEWLLVAALGDGLKVLDCTSVIDKDPDDPQEGDDEDLTRRVRTMRFPGTPRVLDVVPVESLSGALVIAEGRGQRRAIWYPVGYP